jgi:hypothetical protein
MKPQRTTYETTIDTDEDVDIPVLIEFTITLGGLENDEDKIDIHSITRVSDATELVLDQATMDKLYDELHENRGDIEADLEGDYADYAYEQHRDQQLMETWND